MVHADAFEDGLAAYQCGDYATALNFWKPLADKGDAAAQNYLGLIYDEGRGPQDDAEAVMSGLAVIVAEAGNNYGEGVPQDYAEAVKWFRKAAEQGFAKAQCNLGSMYEEGKGVPQDYGEALTWYRRAAEQGHAEAQCNLGTMYYNGLGVPEEPIFGYMWFDIAAASGSESARSSRDFVTEMTPDQIAEAKRMAREWMAKHPQ